MLNTDRSLANDTDRRNLGEDEVETQSVEELEDEIAELSAHIDAATYRLLRAIGELDRREAWATGFESTAHWLSWRVGIDVVTARQKVRVARALENLPLISDAFRQGKVSYSKVRAMTRIATPDNEAYLMYIAENGTACHVESVVRAYRRGSRSGDVEEARRQREERYLDMYTDDEGMVVIRGRLPQEVAALLEKALEAAMEALKKEEADPAESCVTAAIPAEAGIPQHSDNTDPTGDPAESRANAVIPAEAGIPQHSDNADPTADSAESWLRGDFAQRRVDALELLAEAALGKGLGGRERGEPYQVMIHVDSAVLAGESDDGLCELETGEGISAESCRRLACDAPHVTVAQDANGGLLHIGRRARKISTPLWRALVSRDRTCQFPGCSRTRHLQAHHIEHWAKGGETNPDNLLLLCRTHHWAVHEGGFRVQGRVPQGLVFRRADGSLLPVSPVRLPINGRAGETLKEANRSHGLKITSNTVDTFWDGESVDYHMAVDGLLACDDDPDGEE